MWHLNNPEKFFKLVTLSLPFTLTWGASARCTDREKRERIRQFSAPFFPAQILPAKWWAFRIHAQKAGNRWDVENIPKLIVDSFSEEQILKDASLYKKVAIYAKDTVEYVRMVQVSGEPSNGDESTIVEIFGAT